MHKILLFIFNFPFLIFATIDGVAPHLSPSPFSPTPLQSTQDTDGDTALMYQRTLGVWKHFHVKSEKSNKDLSSVFNHRQSLLEIQNILPLMDKNNQLMRFLSLDYKHLVVFKDRDSKEVADVVFKLGHATYESTAIKNIKRAANNSPRQFPLKGIKIVLDAGHMSTPQWEERTGKFIQDLAGNKISEGLLTLQTCLVLKKMLTDLGARVWLTRTNHNAVSKTEYDELDLEYFGKRELKNQSHQPWFLTLISSNLSDDALYKAMTDDQNFQNLFDEKSRNRYFILNDDLETRVKKIKNIAPDISMSIHYDIRPDNMINPPNGLNAANYSKVKTYVFGSIDDHALPTNEDRRAALLHLMDTKSWNASRLLSQEVVQSLKNGLSLEFDTEGMGSSYEISPGVFARNLYLTKRLTNHAHTYVECLHYNDPKEFDALQQRDYKLVIAGETTYYSERLLQVANSIKTGILNFVERSRRP